MSSSNTEVPIPPAVEKAMFAAAREILGDGYTNDFLDQVVVSELRWAYREGFQDGLRSKRKRTTKTTNS